MRTMGGGGLQPRRFGAAHCSCEFRFAVLCTLPDEPAVQLPAPGSDAAAMGQGASSIPCQEIIARCLDAENMMKKYAAAGLRSAGGSSERSDFAEEIEYSSALESTIDTLLTTLYEFLQRDSLYALKSSSLLLASAVQLEPKAGVKLPQWADGVAPAAGQVPAGLLVPLVRSAFKVDEDLFDELAAHPAVRLYAGAEDKSKGKEEEGSASVVAATATTRKHLLEELEKSAGACVSRVIGWWCCV